MSLKIQNGKAIYNWSDFDQDMVNIANHCNQFYSYSNHNEKLIVGIPRGGLIAAVKLSHMLDNSELITIEDFYAKKYKANNPILLVVDDINDTGKTFQNFDSEMAHQILQGKVDAPVRYLCLIKRETSPFHTDINGRVIDKEMPWIQFPWES